MRPLLFLFLILTGLSGFSQGVTVIKKDGSLKLPEGKKYAFIEPTTDTSSLIFVATLRCRDRIRSSNIENMYFFLREKANNLGANCYILRHFKIDEINDEVNLILDSYFATDSLLALNSSNHEDNIVFLFGEEKENGKAIVYTINGVIKEIKGGTFHKIELREGEEIRINKGGSTGAIIALNWQPDKKPVFYSLSGFGINMTEQPVTMGYNPKITFNSGAITK